MDPVQAQTIFDRAWEIALSPYGGAFLLGLLSGLLCGWWLINKYIITQKLEAAEALCAARITALERELADIKPIAEKWSAFMERKALESLERA